MDEGGGGGLDARTENDERRDLSFYMWLHFRGSLFFCYTKTSDGEDLMMKKKDLGVLWEPRARSINYRQTAKRFSDFC